MWLLDTVTICEPTKTEPEGSVIDWLSGQANHTLYTSVLCLGEIRRGIERLPGGAKRTHLRQWMATYLPAWFEMRVLPVDMDVAQIWGELTAGSIRTLPAIDSLLASTALHYDLTVVTRNTRDFEALGVRVLNPWSA